MAARSFHKGEASKSAHNKLCSVIDNRDTAVHAFVLRSFEFLDSYIMAKSSLSFNHNTEQSVYLP